MKSMIAIFLLFLICNYKVTATANDTDGVSLRGSTAAYTNYTSVTDGLEQERRGLGGDDCTFADCSCKYQRYSCGRRNWAGTCKEWNFEEDNWCRYKWGSKPQKTIIQDKQKWTRVDSDCYNMKKCDDRTGSDYLGDSIQIGEVGCEMATKYTNEFGQLELEECV